MGGLSSKLLDEMVFDSKGPRTPKTKKIPFDPRSPSDDISRTPITRLDTPDSGVDTTPTTSKIIQVVDPRSPIDDVNRTPIILEKKDASRRPQTAKSSRPANMMLDSFLCKPDSDDKKGHDQNHDQEDTDPRSPTNKVPRTPLEDKVIDLDFNQKEQTELSEASTQERDEDTLVKKLFPSEGPVDKVRRPLSLVQHSNVGKTPKGLLQAKHCKNVEEEYTKTLHSLLPDQENTVRSNTDFVESI